ncbi:MAG: efflux RND transporter periplasmic adaptor subunit [Nitrospinae bacterium]|nr:efflux RND transporter periplasmic adaptor subunit [Nitrospinota bacterium]
MKKALIIGIIALLAAGGGYYAYHQRETGEQEYKTATAERGPLRSAVSATGTVNPVMSVLVGTQVSGRISALHADFNSLVKQGELLAEIDPTAFEAQLEQATASLAVAVAARERAGASLHDAERSRRRTKELFDAQAVSRGDLDQAETNLELARANLNSAKATCQQAEAAVAVALTNLRYTKIHSPVDGTVVSRNVDVGQTVAASFTTPTLFNIARDLKQMQIDTSVNEADIGRVKTGQPVEFTVDAYSDMVFKGTVHQIRIAPAVVQNVVTYDVVVRVDNPELKLKPGMTANVGIIIETRDAALKVPNGALRFKPKTAGKENKKENPPPIHGSGVWILAGDAPRRIAVQTGIGDGSYTEVTSPELKEGMEIIVDTLAQKGKNDQRGHRLF